MPVEEQVAVIYAAVNGYLDDIPVEQVRAFEQGFLQLPADRGRRRAGRDPADQGPGRRDREKLQAAIEAFKQQFASEPGLRRAGRKVVTGHGRTVDARHQAPHQQRQEHAADHQGHGDGGCRQAPPRPGAGDCEPSLSPKAAGGAGPGGAAPRAEGGRTASSHPLLDVAERSQRVALRGDHRRPGPCRRLQRQRHPHAPGAHGRGEPGKVASWPSAAKAGITCASAGLQPLRGVRAAGRRDRLSPWRGASPTS